MQALIAIWIIIFFFFALILIFIWSKTLVISSKIKSISQVLGKCYEVQSELSKLELVLEEEMKDD